MICPNADEWPADFLHQQTLKDAAKEARQFVREAYEKLDQLDANPR